MRWITGLFTVLSLCIQSSVGDEFIRMPLTRRIITQAPPTYDGTLNSIVTSRPAFPGTLRTLHTNTSIPRFNDTIMSSLAESSRESMNNYFTLVYTARLQVGTPPVGTPPQYFDVVFDTGSSDLWVINTNNKKGRQSYMHYFNPSSSSTFQPSGTEFYVPYGTGYARGANAREIVTLLGFKTQSTGVWFGVVNDFDDLFQNSLEPMDGILGLAFSANHAPGTGPGNQADFPTVIDSLKLAGSIPRKMFSFVLDPNEGGDTSLFILGGIPDDISAKYAPTGFVQLPVPQAVYWYVPMQSISLGGDNVASCTVDSPCQSMLDTGTSLIVVPDSVFGQFVNKISSSGRSDCYLTGSNSNQVWCTDFTYDRLPLMTVMFGGSMFVIYPSDYTIVNGNQLMLGISGIASIAGGKFPKCADQRKCFIFGDVFLKQHYTVYDMDYQNVSIAKDYDRPRPNRPEMRTVAKSNSWMYILIIVSVVCGVIGMLFLYRLWRKRQAYLQSEALLQNAVSGAVQQPNRVPLSQRSGGHRLGSAPPAQPDRQRPLLSDATESGY